MKVSDQDYLRQKQYRTSENLQARINLHQRFSTNPIPWYQWISDQIDWNPIQDIVEIGCGTGGFWQAIATHLPGNIRLFLADLSPGMVSVARKNLPFNLSCHYLCADAQYMPFPKARFDLVIANHMLYHVPNIPLALAEISTILRPGGWLCAATNGMEHFSELYALLSELIPENELYDRDLARFSLESAWDILADVFPEIELRIYKDHLQVTELEPLMAYIMSTWRAEKLDNPELIEQCKERLQSEIDKYGYFHITKSQGIFLAKNNPEK